MSGGIHLFIAVSCITVIAIINSQSLLEKESKTFPTLVQFVVTFDPIGHI